VSPERQKVRLVLYHAGKSKVHAIVLDSVTAQSTCAVTTSRTFNQVAAAVKYEEWIDCEMRKAGVQPHSESEVSETHFVSTLKRKHESDQPDDNTEEHDQGGPVTKGWVHRELDERMSNIDGKALSTESSLVALLTPYRTRKNGTPRKTPQPKSTISLWCLLPRESLPSPLFLFLLCVFLFRSVLSLALTHTRTHSLSLALLARSSLSLAPLLFVLQSNDLMVSWPYAT
jgi:hypothetical protein